MRKRAIKESCLADLIILADLLKRAKKYFENQLENFCKPLITSLLEHKLGSDIKKLRKWRNKQKRVWARLQPNPEYHTDVLYIIKTLGPKKAAPFLELKRQDLIEASKSGQIPLSLKQIEKITTVRYSTPKLYFGLLDEKSESEEE